MRVRCAIVAGLLGMLLTAPGVFASSIGPPAPPTCSWCDGPPPPPIPVPTLALTDVSPVSLISVKLSPTHLQRGQTATLHVVANAQDGITTVVQYRDTKPKTYKTQIGDSKSSTTTWKVPSSAGIGKAQIKVTIANSDGTYSTTIPFEVVK